METLGCESALTEVGMERPQRGEATHWAGGALGVNKRPSKRRHGEESTKGLVWEPLKAGLLNPGPNILDRSTFQENLSEYKIPISISLNNTTSQSNSVTDYIVEEKELGMGNAIAKQQHINKAPALTRIHSPSVEHLVPNQTSYLTQCISQAS